MCYIEGQDNETPCTRQVGEVSEDVDSSDEGQGYVDGAGQVPSRKKYIYSRVVDFREVGNNTDIVDEEILCNFYKDFYVI